MSHEIVKGIKIENGKVMVKYCSNNVSPKDYNWGELPTLTKILEEKGQQAIDIEFLRMYEEGIMQPGIKNKYSRAIHRLRMIPDYADFNWRLGGLGESIQDKNRKERIEEFNNLLLQAFHTKDPKDKFIITKTDHRNDNIYAHIRKTSILWENNKTKATIFKYKVDAHNLRKCYTNSDNWNIIQIAGY